MNRAPCPGGALLILLTLPGCAIQTPYLNISQWPVTKRAMYYNQPLPYRIAVLSFLDQRPPEEREGRRAPAMFLLVWNRRVGDYYTGDLVFGGDVAAHLSRQLAAYLEAANAFAHVQYVPRPLDATALPDATHLQQLAHHSQADYLLAGELEHFFGSQHQELSAFFLPLYFISTWGWSNAKTLPWGQTTVRFTLFKGTDGDLLWRRRLETQHILPREGDPMSEAALESFATLAGQLTTELQQLPLESLDVPAAIPFSAPLSENNPTLGD